MIKCTSSVTTSVDEKLVFFVINDQSDYSLLHPFQIFFIRSLLLFVNTIQNVKTCFHLSAFTKMSVEETVKDLMTGLNPRVSPFQ